MGSGLSEGNFLVRNIFSRRLGKIINVVIMDSMIHVKLFKDNKFKWSIHTCIFWGLAMLFLLSILSGFAVEIIPAFGYEEGMGI